MITQLRQDCNYRIAQFAAIQQVVAIQRPDVDQTILERQIGAVQFVLHAHWRFPNV